MPSINDTSATKALNEDQYINKVYDNVIDKQKNLLKENYTTAGTELDAEKQSIQQQTNTNLGRINVEAQKIQQAYKGPKLSPAAQQQAALSMDNQQKKNVSTIKSVQSEADAEIERQRKLLGEQYAAAIKKAQADNDMARAQALYDAAKAEEEQLRALRESAAALMATKGDNSIYEAIANGTAVAPDTTSPTWDGVLKNEESINKIYDAEMESQRQQAQMALNESLSEIEAEQAAEKAVTDKNLTQTYVNALRGAKNYNEVQAAYGLGSGTLAQARLARALGMIGDLADQRGVQMGTAAKRGQQRFSAGQVYRDAIAKSVDTNENKRAQALYKAAEDEERKLISDQQLVGQQYAKNGDYTMLARLYGLTPEQLALLTSQNLSGGNGWTAKDGDDVYQVIKEAIKQEKPYADVLKAIMTNKDSLTSQQINELKNANTENGYKEVQKATVTNSVGANAENSAYWSSQKTQPYTNPSTVKTTAKKVAAAYTDKGARENSAYWSTRK